MDQLDEHDVIPDHKGGSKSDTEAFIELASREEAHKRFLLSRVKLLDVNNWHKVAGNNVVFKLVDGKGYEVKRSAKVGDFFKINIPGPGNNAGEGFDWVQIEDILDDINKEAEEEKVVIKVRPAANPVNDKNDVAHFFSEEATSSFMVKRTGSRLSSSVHGRNEKPNTDSETLVDKARNALFALGAMLGFSSAQWKSLVNGLIENKNEDDNL